MDNTDDTEDGEKISAASQGRKRGASRTKQRAIAQRSLLAHASANALSISLDSSPHPATQSDEQSLLSSPRISAAGA